MAIVTGTSGNDSGTKTLNGTNLATRSSGSAATTS
jgi:hypothetical protein